MAILDIFKKKEAVKKITKKADKKEVVKKEEGEKKVEQPKITKRFVKKTVADFYGIVSKPHISEKATNLGVTNQYTFEVGVRANKHQVRGAIEAIYNVNVLSVNMINIHGKKRRIGRHEGFKTGYKKAIVKIQKDQKIEII